MGQGTFVAKLAVALDEPGTVLLLSWLCDGVGEGAGWSGSTPANLEKLAGHMGEILGWIMLMSDPTLS
jgi:hypothetical protein